MSKVSKRATARYTQCVELIYQFQPVKSLLYLAQMVRAKPPQLRSSKDLEAVMQARFQSWVLIPKRRDMLPVNGAIVLELFCNLPQMLVI